jgi:hypothetical protein
MDEALARTATRRQRPTTCIRRSYVARRALDGERDRVRDGVLELSAGVAVDVDGSSAPPRTRAAPAPPRLPRRARALRGRDCCPRNRYATTGPRSGASTSRSSAAELEQGPRRAGPTGRAERARVRAPATVASSSGARASWPSFRGCSGPGCSRCPASAVRGQDAARARARPRRGAGLRRRRRPGRAGSGRGRAARRGRRRRRLDVRPAGQSSPGAGSRLPSGRARSVGLGQLRARARAVGQLPTRCCAPGEA